MTVPFGFVVLNYANYQEAFDCVDSILRLAGDFHVVVVDNLSPNESHDALVRRFDGVPRVEVVQSGRNGGYSAGNNVGIRVLRARGIENVVIATSDTRVEDPALLQRCDEARVAGAAVVGPYIRGDQPGSQNPLMPKLTLQYIAAIHLGAVWTTMKRLAFGTVLKGRQPGVRPVTDGAPSGPIDVYMVHGCFLYLSEHYLRAFPLLDEDLFMYGEEDLLAFNCIRKGLRTVYDPRMRVFHGDAKSTSSAGDFRSRAMAGSMAALRDKMGLAPLLQAYARGR